MFWRALRGAKHSGSSKSPKEKKLPKSNESIALNEGTNRLSRTLSPRSVGDRLSTSFDTTPDFREQGDDATCSPSIPSTSISGLPRSNSKALTPKSVSFAITNWKQFAMLGVDQLLLQSIEGLLAEQRHVFSIDMFAELTDDDQKESEFLQSYGYKFEETALAIFNRKRELVIPKPGDLFRIAKEMRKIPYGSTYAADRDRRYQVFLAMLSEQEQVCLTLLLSEQEKKFGKDMFHAVTDEDEAEVSTLLAQGYRYDDIAHMIFQRKFEPSVPYRLIHPMQQQQGMFRASSFPTRHPSYHDDNRSIHSQSMYSASSNTFSMNSIHSSNSPRNIFQPVVASPAGSNSSSPRASSTTSTQRTPVYDMTGNNYSGTTRSEGFRMPASGSAYLFMPMPGNSNSSVTSTANTVNNNAAAFCMPPQIPHRDSPHRRSTTNGDLWPNPLRSENSSASSSVASGVNKFSSNNQSPLDGVHSPMKPVSETSQVSPVRRASVNSNISSSIEPLPCRQSVLALAGEHANADAEALSMAILAQQNALQQSQMANSNSSDIQTQGNALPSSGQRLIRTASTNLNWHQNPLAGRRVSMRSPSVHSMLSTASAHSRPSTTKESDNVSMNL